MPHQPEVVVWTLDGGIVTLGVKDLDPKVLDQIKVIRGVHQTGPEKIKHFEVDVEKLAKSKKRPDDYDVYGKVTAESKDPTKFDYKNLVGVLMMDTADHMHPELKTKVIKELNDFIQKVNDLPP